MTDGPDLIASLPVAAFVTDADGWVVRHNAAAAALWGRSPAPGAARWSGAVRLLAADGAPLPPEAAPAARLLAGAAPVPDAGRGPEGCAGPALDGPLIAERPDGSRIGYVARPALLRDADGRVAGVVELMLEPAAIGTADSELAAARLAAIVSSSDDAIVGKSLEGRVTSWNDGAMRMFGWTSEEMAGQPITRIIPAELLHEETEILARLRRGERVAPFDTERLRKDGGRVVVSVTVSPIRDAGGRVVGASKIARDVGARKRAEATQRRLFDELTHRVKNTLATIQAIARQSLRRAASPEAFVQSFDGRVGALARAHDLLVAGGMAGADLAGLVRALVGPEDENPGGDAEAGRIRVGGPALTLEPRVAVQMALVLHELDSNARRHGALSVPDGRLGIDWRIEAGSDGRWLALDWQEAGGAAPAAGEPGFGIAMIERSLTASGGSATRRAGPDGFGWEIRLPLPETAPGPSPAAAGPAAGLGAAAGPLGGRRVLVVEDEPLLAMEIESELAEAGAAVVGPAGTLEAAARLIEAGAFDAALLDANLAGRPVGALAAALAERGVPFAFASGYGVSGLPEGFRDRPLLGKPFSAEALLALVGSLLAGPQPSADDGTVVPLVVPLRKSDF